MAHGARHGVIGREATVEEQATTQSDFLWGQGIVVGNGQGSGKAEGNAECGLRDGEVRAEEENDQADDTGSEETHYRRPVTVCLSASSSTVSISFSTSCALNKPVL